MTLRSFRFATGALLLAAAFLHAGSDPDPRVDLERKLSRTVPFERSPYIQLATTNSIFVVFRSFGPMTPEVRFGTRSDYLDRRSLATNIIIRASLGTAPKTNQTEKPKTNKTDKVSAPTTNHPVKAVQLTKLDKLLGQWRTPANEKLPKLHSAPLGEFQYEIKLTGLEPDTKYYYAVYDGSRRLTPDDGTCYFATLPLRNSTRPVRFWLLGDSGSGREGQIATHQAMIRHLTADRHPLDFFIHLGDIAYMRGRDVEFQTRFFEIYEPTLRKTVVWPTMGNHEGMTSKGTNGTGPYYDAFVLPARAEAGGLPSGTEAYYSWDYAGIHFICLNSHDLDRRPYGAMARWLRADLDAAKANWLIAYFHHPPYTKGSHDSDKEKQLVEMRAYMMPILENGGVDLVFTGHSHIYERSMLVDGAYATPTTAEGVILDDGDGDPHGMTGAYRKSAGLNANEGCIQIVAGNGGITLGRKGTLPLMRKTIVEHGSVLVDVAGETMTVQMVNKFGETRDLFSIVKRGKVTPVRLSSPWQPTPWTAPKNAAGDLMVDPPEDYLALIPAQATWRYLAGSHPPSSNDWTRLDFDDHGWSNAPMPFGFGYPTARTVLTNMQGNYSVVYLRHKFEIEQADHYADVGLIVGYDDAFIAYLNGKEVARKNVEGQGKRAKNIKPRDVGRYGYVPLKDFEKYLQNGENVLCIEAHNANVDSHDFFIDAFLVSED